MKKSLMLTFCFILIGLSGVAKAGVFSQNPVQVPVQVIPLSDVDSGRQEDSIYYCSLVNYTGIGLTAGGTFELGVRLTPAELGAYAGWNIIALEFYHYDGTSSNGSANIYDEGTATNPGALLHSTAYSGGIVGWQRITLSSPVPINGSTDLWCSIEVNHPAGGYPGGCDAGPMLPDGGWIYFGGAWATLASYGLNYNWQLLVIVEQGGPSNLIVWDFETGPQGWTHSNGQAFPQGWGVMESGLNGNNWTIPSSGDSSLWVDDNAAGGNAYIYQDSAFAPAIIPDTNTDWLWYGLSYNLRTAGEWMEVGIKYFDGAVWTPVQLRTYTADFSPAVDSVDVSAYKTYTYLQVYFYYDDGGGRGWYGAVDNIGICGTFPGVVYENNRSKPAGFGFVPGMRNPVTGLVSISFSVASACRVDLKIYDNSGRIVGTLLDGFTNKGTNTVTWNTQNLSSGVYFAVLETGNSVDTHKLLLAK